MEVSYIRTLRERVLRETDAIMSEFGQINESIVTDAFIRQWVPRREKYLERVNQEIDLDALELELGFKVLTAKFIAEGLFEVNFDIKAAPNQPVENIDFTIVAPNE